MDNFLNSILLFLAILTTYSSLDRIAEQGIQMPNGKTKSDTATFIWCTCSAMLWAIFYFVTHC